MNEPINSGAQAALTAAEERLRAYYGPAAHIVKQMTLYPTSAPVTAVAQPIEAWMFQAETVPGMTITLFALQSSAGWSVVQNAREPGSHSGEL
jgi:hypothetical protein